MTYRSVSIKSLKILAIKIGHNLVGNTAEYAKLKNVWFSTEKTGLPDVFMIDTMEEAELIADWVKIKMLRCQDDDLLNFGA